MFRMKRLSGDVQVQKTARYINTLSTNLLKCRYSNDEVGRIRLNYERIWGIKLRVFI
jgi:hypothetical protein